MNKKTVLLVDDEQPFLEPLEDALVYEGYDVKKARTVTQAIDILANNQIDLITIDIMLDPGPAFVGKVESASAGLLLCKMVREKYPKLDAFCISVIGDPETIRSIRRMGIPFLRKGETPLRKVVNILKSRLTGTSYEREFG